MTQLYISKEALLEHSGAVCHVTVSNMNSLCVTYTVACSGNFFRTGSEIHEFKLPQRY